MAEVGPNYTLLRSKETKAKRRKRKREDARAALDGHTCLLYTSDAADASRVYGVFAVYFGGGAH